MPIVIMFDTEKQEVVHRTPTEVTGSQLQAWLDKQHREQEQYTFTIENA